MKALIQLLFMILALVLVVFTLGYFFKLRNTHLPPPQLVKKQGMVRLGTQPARILGNWVGNDLLLIEQPGPEKPEYPRALNPADCKPKILDIITIPLQCNVNLSNFINKKVEIEALWSPSYSDVYSVMSIKTIER